MGLLTGLVTAPLTPLRGMVWLAERLQEQAEQQMYDPARLAAELQDVADAAEAGEISPEEAVRREEEIVGRLSARAG